MKYANDTEHNNDPYCYRGTNILRNKIGITSSRELLRAEIELTSLRLFELQNQPFPQKLDLDRFKAIHKHIFQDLFTWAGEFRTINIAKGDIFGLVQYIDDNMTSFMSSYFDECFNNRKDFSTFVKTFAKHYGNINAVHPFREGNGRTQREFAREVCLRCGYIFDLSQTSHEEMLEASKFSLYGHNEKFEDIFSRILMPVTAEFISNNPEFLYVLSLDDIPSEIDIQAMDDTVYRRPFE